MALRPYQIFHPRPSQCHQQPQPIKHHPPASLKLPKSVSQSVQASECVYSSLPLLSGSTAIAKQKQTRDGSINLLKTLMSILSTWTAPNQHLRLTTDMTLNGQTSRESQRAEWRQHTSFLPLVERMSFLLRVEYMNCLLITEARIRMGLIHHSLISDLEFYLVQFLF